MTEDELGYYVNLLRGHGLNVTESSKTPRKQVVYVVMQLYWDDDTRCYTGEWFLHDIFATKEAANEYIAVNNSTRIEDWKVLEKVVKQ